MSELIVPGAKLHYERVGSGPLLLLIPGGNGDAGTMMPLANELADRYTVVGYDRRGYSRSPVDGPVDDHTRLAADVEDAVALIRHLTDEPASVLGSSSGAIVALHLLTGHPDAVRVLVAHEPPLATLLPDAESKLAFLDEIHQIYRERGIEAAMTRFAEGTGLGRLGGRQGDGPPPAPLLAMMERMRHNQPFWIEHELRQYPRAEPDLNALRRNADRLKLAGGEESREHWPYFPNKVIAERLGIPIADLPGGHVGYLTHRAGFAARLAEILAAQR